MKKPKKTSGTIIDPRRRCHFCGAETNLQKHHALHGTANRKLADKDGLFVWLCVRCHMNLHDRGERDEELKQEAQRCYMAAYQATAEDFRRRYGKSYL